MCPGVGQYHQSKGRWTNPTLHEVYLSKAAPTLYHPKLLGRDQWEVRKQITGAEAKNALDGNLIKM